MENQSIKIDVNSLKAVNCPYCLEQFFTVEYQLKIIPAMLSPTGGPTVLKVENYRCSNCHAIIKDIDVNDNKKEKNVTPKTN